MNNNQKNGLLAVDDSAPPFFRAALVAGLCGAGGCGGDLPGGRTARDRQVAAELADGSRSRPRRQQGPVHHDRGAQEPAQGPGRADVRTVAALPARDRHGQRAAGRCGVRAGGSSPVSGTAGPESLGTVPWRQAHRPGFGARARRALRRDSKIQAALRILPPVPIGRDYYLPRDPRHQGGGYCRSQGSGT